jgi:hypothetical protein
MDDQNPARQSRQAFIALFAIVVGVAVAFLTLPIEMAVFFAPPGLVGAIMALAVGCIRFEQARNRSKMERGEGVVARWTLDGALWQEFVRLNERTITLPTIAAERSLTCASGVEVVFAPDAVYVDGHFYTMDRHWGTGAKVETAAQETSFIELAQGGLEDVTPIRVPIPPGRQSDAERVAHYFNSPPGKG